MQHDYGEGEWSRLPDVFRQLDGQQASSLLIHGLHCPVKKANIVSPSGTRREGRQLCEVCEQRVNTYCEQCDVALCFGDYEKPDESCFKKYHTHRKK